MPTVSPASSAGTCCTSPTSEPVRGRPRRSGVRSGHGPRGESCPPRAGWAMALVMSGGGAIAPAKCWLPRSARRAKPGGFGGQPLVETHPPLRKMPGRVLSQATGWGRRAASCRRRVRGVGREGTGSGDLEQRMSGACRGEAKTDAPATPTSSPRPPATAATSPRSTCRPAGRRSRAAAPPRTHLVADRVADDQLVLLTRYQRVGRDPSPRPGEADGWLTGRQCGATQTQSTRPRWKPPRPSRPHSLASMSPGRSWPTWPWRNG
ncbi:hypothetical protein T45_06896 [Streptomyces turgidiscabies]|nr:hypothetical protein T45_06896 [Streptomyces turgidiscabies]